MNIIVDSSIAIKWFVKETWHEEALEIANGNDDLFAPDLIVPEVTNIAWKKALRREITEQQALDIAVRIGSEVPVLCRSSLLNEAALRIGISINHPIYDCLFVACAQMLGGFVVTVDRRLCQAVMGTTYAPLVTHISQI